MLRYSKETYLTFRFSSLQSSLRFPFPSLSLSFHAFFLFPLSISPLAFFWNLLVFHSLYYLVLHFE